MKVVFLYISVLIVVMFCYTCNVMIRIRIWLVLNTVSWHRDGTPRTTNKGYSGGSM